MKRSPKPPPSEQSISDGMRHLGHLTPKMGAFECYDATGAYLCKVETLKAARAAILAADRRAA